MGSYPPIALVLALAVALLFSRPWLDARRPLLSLALLAGAVLGPAGVNLAPPDLAAAMAPVTALCAGWLAFLTAESWDMATLRRSRWGAVILWVAVPALVLGWYFAAVAVACAALALDPDAVRDGLRRSDRPAPAARLAPGLAAVSLGVALLAGSLGDPRGPLIGLVALPLGAALGLVCAGLLRLADGRAFVLTLLIAMTVMVSGAARALGFSALATLFVAGVVLGRDTARRDLIYSTLREYERPVTAALLLLAGLALPSFAGAGPVGAFWACVVILVLMKPLAWILVPSAGLTWRQALPLSPLVIPLAFEAGAAWTASSVALSFALAELLSRLPERRAA